MFNATSNEYPSISLVLERVSNIKKVDTENYLLNFQHPNRNFAQRLQNFEIIYRDFVDVYGKDVYDQIDSVIMAEYQSRIHLRDIDSFSKKTMKILCDFPQECLDKSIRYWENIANTSKGFNDILDDFCLEFYESPQFNSGHRRDSFDSDSE